GAVVDEIFGASVDDQAARDFRAIGGADSHLHSCVLLDQLQLDRVAGTGIAIAFWIVERDSVGCEVDAHDVTREEFVTEYAGNWATGIAGGIGQINGTKVIARGQRMTTDLESNW